MNKAKVILLLALALMTHLFLQTEYTLTTTVIEVQQPTTDNPEGSVFCLTDKGDIFTFQGSEDWLQGDIAEITLNDNGTAYRNDDDKVINAIYKGYIY